MKSKSYYLENEEQFGAITSRIYDFFSWVIPSMKEFYEFVLDDLKGSNGKSMLDVGCGSGGIAIRLASLKSAKIYGVDPSKSMIGIAKRRSSNIGNLNFDLGSSRYVPFNRKFDVIFTTLSYHHWAEKKRSLIYLSKLLNNNGEIRIYEFNKKQQRDIMSMVSKHSASKEEIFKVTKMAKLIPKDTIKKSGFIRVSLKRK